MIFEKLIYCSYSQCLE